VNLLCTDVGPVRPTDFARTRHHPRPEAGPTTAGGPTAAGGPPAGEADRVLRRVERNLTALTRAVPMAEIEDLPPGYATTCSRGASDLGPVIPGILRTSLFTIAGPIGLDLR
jgi:hypothetical protein